MIRSNDIHKWIKSLIRSFTKKINPWLFTRDLSNPPHIYIYIYIYIVNKRNKENVLHCQQRWRSYVVHSNSLFLIFLYVSTRWAHSFALSLIPFHISAVNRFDPNIKSNKVLLRLAFRRGSHLHYHRGYFHLLFLIYAALLPAIQLRYLFWMVFL